MMYEKFEICENLRENSDWFKNLKINTLKQFHQACGFANRSVFFLRKIHA